MSLGKLLQGLTGTNTSNVEGITAKYGLLWQKSIVFDSEGTGRHSSAIYYLTPGNLYPKYVLVVVEPLEDSGSNFDAQSKVHNFYTSISYGELMQSSSMNNCQS